MWRRMRGLLPRHPSPQPPDHSARGWPQRGSAMVVAVQLGRCAIGGRCAAE